MCTKWFSADNKEVLQVVRHGAATATTPYASMNTLDIAHYSKCTERSRHTKSSEQVKCYVHSKCSDERSNYAHRPSALNATGTPSAPCTPSASTAKWSTPGGSSSAAPHSKYTVNSMYTK